jgi:hypothetical protein
MAAKLSRSQTFDSSPNQTLLTPLAFSRFRMMSIAETNQPRANDADGEARSKPSAGHSAPE